MVSIGARHLEGRHTDGASRSMNARVSAPCDVIEMLHGVHRIHDTGCHSQRCESSRNL